MENNTAWSYENSIHLSRIKKTEINKVAEKFAKKLYDHNHVAEGLKHANLSNGSGNGFDIYKSVRDAYKRVIVENWEKFNNGN